MALINRIKYDGSSTNSSEQSNWLVYKHPSDNLVLGSQLIVNQSQEAIFYKAGVALDVFGPGTHTLSTENLPLLHKLVNLPFGGQTPFTAEVYFVNKVAKLDMKWGTSDPFNIVDPKYQIMVRVRAFGQFGLRVSDSRNLVTQLIGALNGNQVSDFQIISRHFKGLVLNRVKDTVADLILRQNVSVLDLAAALSSTSITCQERITNEFDRFGLEVLNFFIESINVADEDLEKIKHILDEKAAFEILGDERYIRKRSFDVLESAASNEGAGGGALAGGLGLGMGLGAGTAAAGAISGLGRQMDLSVPQYPTAKTKCNKCGFECSSGAKFCGNCGSQFVDQTLKCPGCQADNSPEMKFCTTCGGSLAKKVCTACNSQFSAGTVFCGTCGKKLEE